MEEKRRQCVVGVKAMFLRNAYKGPKYYNKPLKLMNDYPQKWAELTNEERTYVLRKRGR